MTARPVHSPCFVMLYKADKNLLGRHKPLTCLHILQQPKPDLQVVPGEEMLLTEKDHLHIVCGVN